MRFVAPVWADRRPIVMCGHHRTLAEALRAAPATAARVLVGFTPDDAHWVRLGDYFIGKPGPGALSEALHCGLPVVVARNAWTMPHERDNTDLVQDEGVDVVLPGFAHVREGVAQMLAHLPALRSRVARLDTRALFERLQVLASIVDAAQGARARADQAAAAGAGGRPTPPAQAFLA